ncbi:hypothetical protein E2562_001069 [Oryza meyeriana var. granulata]|uniref:Uncharacterized protein n=1 Tax=Oryza meyeriana var. granulata TaxID=110450 RepID=A0A6G1EDC0_9ORYZ|nr:hypothetical protein E2562_001069 [Oryza meyeriana var. granulata]
MKSRSWVFVLGAPQVFDHGSISFGRFELESLAWEKWSVFANDRRHEEFGKFNGLVAKKKAYFEEYFKRIRELKALQQQNQQTELNLEYSGDGSDSSQTGDDVPTADKGSPSGSGTLIDSVQNTNCGQDDLGMPSESTMTPKRTVKKDSLVGQGT